MTNDENKIETRLTTLEQQFAVIMTKADLTFEEIRQQREDMRRLWERQDEERRAREVEMREARKKHDEDIKEMNQRFYTKVDSLDKKIDDKFDKLSDQIHTMTIAAVVGFGAIAAAVGSLVFAAFK